MRWNTAEKPSMRFSNKGSSASGVTSRPVKPVPPVVADCLGGRDRLLDIALLQRLPALLGTVGPHAGEAVRHQLDAHGQLVRLDPAHLLLPLLHALEHAEQV